MGKLFVDLLGNLDRTVGVFEIIIPMAMVFIISYLTLQLVHFLKPGQNQKNKKTINNVILILSILFSIAFVMPHYKPSLPYPDYVPLLLNLMPQFSTISFVIFILFIVLGVFNLALNPEKDKSLFIKRLGFWFSFLMTILIIFSELDRLNYVKINVFHWFYNTLGLADPRSKAIFLGVSFFLMVVYFVTRNYEGNKPNNKKKPPFFEFNRLKNTLEIPVKDLKITK